MSEIDLLHGNQQLKSGEQKKKLKTDMFRSIGKQFGKSMESARKKKRKATVGRICRKGRF